MACDGLTYVQVRDERQVCNSTERQREIMRRFCMQLSAFTKKRRKKNMTQICIWWLVSVEELTFGALLRDDTAKPLR